MKNRMKGGLVFMKICFLAVILSLSALISTCSIDGQNQSKSSPAAANTFITNYVAISNYSFNPSNLTVPVFSTVKWSNLDPMVHDAAQLNGGFESGPLTQGQDWSYFFEAAGLKSYICNYHSGMYGTILVTN